MKIQFPGFKNRDTAFKHVRLFTAIIAAGCFILCGITTCLSYRSTQESQNRIYLLAAGKVLEALASDRKENIPVEAKDHVWSFHRLFFSLAPDEKAIEANMEEALYLADESAKKVYDNFKESKYYSNVLNSNVSQEVTMDSILLDMQPYPYHFIFYGEEKIIRPSSVVTRRLWTEGWLRNVIRSEKNPHGFLIERWNILDNHDLKIESR